MGDYHAATLVQALLAADDSTEVMALGGERTAAAGATLLGDNTGLSSIGLLEALPLVWPTLVLQQRAQAALREQPPDVAVLIDYPGVNLPLGRFLRSRGVRVIYYIPPNEWLWTEWRTAAIVSMCDVILCNYADEAEYFARNGGNTKLVGHPLVDLVASAPSRQQARARMGLDAADTVVLLTPASRFQEVRLVWPVIAEAAHILQQRNTASAGPPLRLVLCIAAPHLREALLTALAASALDEVLVWEGDSQIAMAAADLALTKSGSINLQLALLDIPQVVVYRIGSPTAWLARRLFDFHVPRVSLCNLILGCDAVPELVQERATPQAVAAAAAAFLGSTDARAHMLHAYDTLRQSLGAPGVAARAARCVAEAARAARDERGQA